MSYRHAFQRIRVVGSDRKRRGISGTPCAIFRKQNDAALVKEEAEFAMSGIHSSFQENGETDMASVCLVNILRFFNLIAGESDECPQ